MTRRTVESGRWLLAAAAAVVGIVLLWSLQSGSCASSIGATRVGDASCASGPAVGVAGAWVLTIGGGLFAAYALRRAYGILQRQSRP